MGSLDESQCLSKPPDGTVAELRHPSAGKRDPYCPETNPLRWRLGGDRRWHGVTYSRLVLKFGLFGFLMAAFTVGLAIFLPRFFSAQNFNFLTAFIVSAHVFWLSTSMWRRIQSWKHTSFLDELLLTNLSSREITTALAHAAARPIGASFLGSLVPIYVYQGICGYCGIAPLPMAGHTLLVWLFLAPFVLLALFALPWMAMSIAWNPCAGRHWPAAVIAGWIAVPPWLALSEDNFATLAIGLFALVAIQLGVLNSHRVAGFLDARE